MTDLCHCPFCGEPSAVIAPFGDEHQAYCTNCGAEGPNAPTIEKAADAWNQRKPPRVEDLTEVGPAIGSGSPLPR